MKSLSAQSKITRRRILTGTAATAVVTATSRPRRAAAQSPVKLSIIGLDGHPSWLATKAMIEAYRDVAPNVSFELSQFDLPQIGDKVNLDFQAKKGQDHIVWMNSASTIGYWSEAGIVVPLDAMVSESYDLNDFLRLARGISTLRGKLYGIPIMIEGRMLVYRKDLLDAAGMKPPTTVDEMTRAAQAMNAPAKNQYRLLAAGPLRRVDRLRLGRLALLLRRSNLRCQIQPAAGVARGDRGFGSIHEDQSVFGTLLQPQLRRDRQRAAVRHCRHGQRRHDHYAFARGRQCVPVCRQVRLRGRAGRPQGASPGDLVAPARHLHPQPAARRRVAVPGVDDLEAEQQALDLRRRGRFP